VHNTRLRRIAHSVPTSDGGHSTTQIRPCRSSASILRMQIGGPNAKCAPLAKRNQGVTPGWAGPHRVA